MTTRSKAAAVQRSAPLMALARVGYAVNGILFLLIGGLAIATIFGPDEKTDQNGALTRISEQPFGMVLLWVIAIGFGGLAIFYLFEALLYGGKTDRLKDAGRTITYAVLAFVTVGVALGHGASSNGPQSLSATILAQPAGVALLLLVAAGIFALGIYNVVKGVTRRFTDDLRMPQPPTSRIIIVVGTLGYVAKGIAFGTIGVLFAVAALTSNAAEAGGLDEALNKLSQLPFGSLVLAVVAIGFLAFGIYCFVRAKYAKL